MPRLGGVAGAPLPPDGLAGGCAAGQLGLGRGVMLPDLPEWAGLTPEMARKATAVSMPPDPQNTTSRRSSSASIISSIGSRIAAMAA